MCASWPPPRSILNRRLPKRKLREDLYYRLSAFTVHVPALRQRKEEIPLLLGHFMNQLARRYSLPARIFSAAALEACQRHSWPGNLRELEKFVKRYLVMGDGATGLAALDHDDRRVLELILAVGGGEVRLADRTGRDRNPAFPA